MEIFTILRTAEFNIAGFLVPWAMVIWSGAYVLALICSNLIERFGGYRYVWHPPLMFIALTIIIGSCAGMLLAP